MMVSWVYVNFVNTLRRSAARREKARKPLAASGTLVFESWRTTQLPTRWRSRLKGPKCASCAGARSPITMSASPARIGATSRGTSAPGYWLSASVLTITSAPSLRAASSPAEKAVASPRLVGKRRSQSAPAARATSAVRSREPSSITRISTVSMPGTLRGRSAIVAARVASSLKQGIWMMSFGTRGVSLTPGGLRCHQHVDVHHGAGRGEATEHDLHRLAPVGRHPGRARAAHGLPPKPRGRAQGRSRRGEAHSGPDAPATAQRRVRRRRPEQRTGEGDPARRPAMPGGRPPPGVRRIATIAPRCVPALQVLAAVGLDETQQRVGHIELSAAHALHPLVDVPDKQPLTRELAVDARARAVLEQVILLRPARHGGDAHDAGRGEHRRQRHVPRGRRHRLDVHPPETQLRPRIEPARYIPAADPGPLPHEPPHADALLGSAARRVQLGQPEQMPELVTEDAKVAERRHLLLGDHAGI